MSRSKESVGRDEFSQNNTSTVGTVPNLLTAFDLANIICEEQSISNADYTDNNTFDRNFEKTASVGADKIPNVIHQNDHKTLNFFFGIKILLET